MASDEILLVNITEKNAFDVFVLGVGVCSKHEWYCGADTVLVWPWLGGGWIVSAGEENVLFKCGAHCGEEGEGLC